MIPRVPGASGIAQGIRQKKLWYGLILATVFVLAYQLPRWCVAWWPTPTFLVIDMKVDTNPKGWAGNVDIWVNQIEDRNHFWQPYVPGVRQSYSFRLPSASQIELLRIDPTDRKDVEAWLYEVRIERNGKVLRRFTPEELAWWDNNVPGSKVRDGAFVVKATHPDPILKSVVYPPTQTGLPRKAWIGELIDKVGSSSQSARTACLVVLVLGVIASELLAPGGWFSLLMLLLALPATCGVLELINRLPSHPPHTANAVGYAAYAGYGNSSDPLRALALLLVPTLVVCLSVLLRRRLARRTSAAPVMQDACDAMSAEKKGSPWWHGLILGALVIVLFCYIFPALAAIRATDNLPLHLGWDRNNFLVWEYLLQTGSRAYIDFWYPYAGMQLFDLRFPFGELMESGNIFLILSVMLLALYLCCEKRLGVTLAIFCTVFGLMQVAVLENVWRYGLITNAILCYAALDPQVRRLTWRHALFWLAFLQLAIIEPLGLFYVSLPIGGMMAARWLRGPRPLVPSLVRSCLREFGLPFMILTAIVGIMAVKGQLSGFMAYMATLDSQAAYCSYPCVFKDWLRFPWFSEAFVVWSIMVLGVLGLVGVLDRSNPRRGASAVVYLLAIATALLFLKQLVRPHMAGQMLSLPVTGLLVWIFAARRSARWQVVQSVAVAGILLGALFADGAFSSFRAHTATFKARFLTSLPYLRSTVQEREGWTVQRFDPARYDVPEEYRQIAAAARESTPPGSPHSLFVLSDDAVLYILVGSRPYFHTNFYNSAPLVEQQHVVRLLTEDPPQIVAWRWADAGVDTVPPWVRNPLIYEHIILHYVQLRPVGAFDLLRRRKDGEPLALDFWQQKLGSSLNLGHLPRYSSYARFPAGEESEFLHVRIRDRQALDARQAERRKLPALAEIGGYRPKGLPVRIPVECGGRHFSILLTIVPDESEYHVLLDRLWFWGALRKVGLSPKLGTPEPGIEVEIERRGANDSILY